MTLLRVPRFSNPSKDVGAPSPLPNPGSSPARNAAVQGLRQERERLTGFERYRFDPAAYLREKLGWEPWEGEGDDRPGQVEVLDAYALALRQMHERRDWENGEKTEEELEYWRPGEVIKNIIRVEAGHTVGKTKVASGVFSHFFDCFPPAIAYSFAPSWDQIKSLLWKEIETDRRGKDLPGRILEDCEIKYRPNHFAKGRATDNSGGKGTERIQGQHGAYLIFIVDEAEGVDDYVFNAIDSMASGGIVVVLLLANPRTRISRFHKLGSRANVKNLRISCLHHPNVLAGREVVPAAVRRDYVLTMVEGHCEPVTAHDPDNLTFSLPYPAAKNGVEHPAGQVWQPDAEFCFRVLGVAPANNADDTFVPVGRYEAATKRAPVSHEPAKARIGIDVARFGNDFGTIYVRHDGRMWRHGFLAKLDSGEYFRRTKEAARALKERGVTSLHVRVDGGGGFGGGVVDLLRKDDELRAWFSDFRVLEVHNNGAPHDEKAFKDLGTEMYAHAAETLKGVAVLAPPEALEADLCERTFDWVNVKGVDVKKLSPKDEFKRDHRRSPDDGDGFCLAAAPDFIFNAVPDAPAYSPVFAAAGAHRRR